MRALATAEQPLHFGLALRLGDPAAAPAFARRLAGNGGLGVQDWRRQREELTEDSRRLLTILQATTLLALLAAAFTLATAIGGRVLAQRRQIGLLRAIGLTPAGVTGVLVAHYLVLALLAAPLGLVGGALVADRLSGDFAATLGAPSAGAPGPGLLALALLSALRSGRGGDRAARVARRPHARPGRARARARRQLRARIACRPHRAAPAPPRGGRPRRQGRVRPARPDRPDRGESRVGRRARRHRDELRGDDGPPRQRAGAARPALRPARRVGAAGGRGRPPARRARRRRRGRARAP